jgi:murein DD-endopeptidase MepM/ murein hydrolase activator NlpD
MNEKDAAALLKTELSDSFYSHNKLPAAALFYGEESVPIYPNSGEWLLKKSDGLFYPSTVESATAEVNAARAYQNRPFDIRFPIPPDALFIEVIDGKEIVYSDIFGNFDANFTRGEMKDLQYVLNAEWWEKEDADFCGSAKYVLNVKYFVQAKFDISQAEAAPGDIVAITAHNISEEDNLTLAGDMGFEAVFASVGTNKIAFIPIAADSAGKTFNLTLTSDANDPINYFLKINQRSDFKSVNMGAQDQYVAAHLEPGPQAERRAKQNDIFSVPSEPSQNDWLEKFSMPREGKLLLEYGWKVTVNMGYPQIYSGVLIDLFADDPVKAANGGRVVFAGVMPYEGNLIVIDHGAGIKSWYGHLGKIDVKPGDNVMKGQQIGSGGRTGMVTGISMNYLYFAISAGNVFVDPVPVISKGLTGVEALISEVYEYGLPEQSEENADMPEPAQANTEDGENIIS